MATATATSTYSYARMTPASPSHAELTSGTFLHASAAARMRKSFTDSLPSGGRSALSAARTPTSASRETSDVR